MIRPRSATPLQRLAGSGLRWTLGDRRMPPAVSSTLASTGWVATGQEQQARPRSTTASAVPGHLHHNVVTRGSWGASEGRVWGTGRHQRLHSCRFLRDTAKTSRAVAVGTGLAGRPPSDVAGSHRSKTTRASSPPGAETANGITFETGKVSFSSILTSHAFYIQHQIETTAVLLKANAKSTQHLVLRLCLNQML